MSDVVCSISAWSHDSSLSLPVKEKQILCLKEQENNEGKREDEDLSTRRTVPKPPSLLHELFSELQGQRARFSVADKSTVDRSHRHDFHAGVREKAFVGPVQPVNGIATFFN